MLFVVVVLVMVVIKKKLVVFVVVVFVVVLVVISVEAVIPALSDKAFLCIAALSEKARSERLI